MSRRQNGFFIALGLGTIAVISGLRLNAQDDKKAPVTPPNGASVQDALLRRFDFPFAKPTRLSEVAKVLSKALNAPVALDRAALDRQDVLDEDEVQLDLRGVRLKTGLKLLLDQLDLTYRVEADDNLLVITDRVGSVDPQDLMFEEMKALHRDMHTLQDSVDKIKAGLGLDENGGPKMRKPTIIEEVPGDEKVKPRSKEGPPVTTPARPRVGL